MKQTLIALLAVLSVACATTTPVTTAPAPEPAAATPAASTVAAAPCNPGHAIVNATLWMQSSAEYHASATQVYAAARRALDAALADPAWTGSPEETSTDPSQPPAIVLDLDETTLDNTPFEVRSIRLGKTYDEESWKQWVAEGAAHAVPGAPEFLAYAKSRGVTPFYVTNRDHDEETGTRANLVRLGFPLDPKVDTLLMRGKDGFTQSDKGPRRAHVAKSYRLLLLLGDDLNDFANARDKSAAERAQIVRDTASYWGTRWFILPNPIYGSWERAMIGSGGTPCELLQRKVDALKDR